MVPIAIEVIGENCKDCVNIEIETIRTVDATGSYLGVKNTLRCKHYDFCNYVVMLHSETEEEKEC